jgi:D-sedoheptulose 7-phosphate isomerase
MSFTDDFLNEVKMVVDGLDRNVVEKAAQILAEVRMAGGRLFILGVGGSAASSSHSVNDFRKIAGMEAYAPTDNVAELTARTNDDGWASVFVNWLKVSHLNAKDALLIMSVGGGNIEKNISANIVEALKLAKDVGARVVGIVGRDGGYTARVADACVVIPTVNPAHITPHTESFHSVICHLLVTHPRLKHSETKWESTR